MAELVVFVQDAVCKLHAETAEVPIGLSHFAAFGAPPEHVLGKTLAERFTGEDGMEALISVPTCEFSKPTPHLAVSWSSS
jgi:hypothetical protein